MNRRTSLKGLGVIAAGIALFPGCSDQLNMKFELNEIFTITPKQGTWINAMSQAIIPYGDREIETLESFPTFVTNMVSQLLKQEDQDKFVSGYNICTKELKETINSNTEKITPIDIIAFFKSKLDEQELETATPEEKLSLAHGQYFINRLRGLSINHLTTSQAYMEQVDNYSIIPGSYQGAVEV